MPRNIFNASGSTESEYTDPETFLLYHGASHVTGERLGQYLGVPHGRECERRYDNLIRWGHRGSAGYVPRNGPVNSRSAIQTNTDKYRSLETFDEAGIPVPEYTRDRDEIADTFGYPALGRADSHTRGEDINLILQWRDAYLTDGNDFFVEYIPTDLEYRVHVVNGEVIHVHEKRLRSEASNHPFIRNSETGWVFVEPRDEPPEAQIAIDAVGCLGLDFGAVDIIRGEDGEEYVLEVNTAPSLDESNLERYGDAFADMLDFEPSGMSAVEWDEEEEGAADEEDDDDDESGTLFGL